MALLLRTIVVHAPACLWCLLAAAWLAGQSAEGALTNQTVRVLAANLTSSGQNYATAGINIFKGLKPDIVAIQEFRYGTSTPEDIRALVDTAFGANFHYYRESGYSIPNGIISRFPILAAGSWDDDQVNDRGFAWAQLDVPGSNDLYVVSVHLYASGSASDRNAEAQSIKSNVLASFPAGAWVIVAGDFNTSARSEAAVDTFKTFLSDNPIPTDAESGGDPDTNDGRDKPYDYVLPSFSFATNLVPAVFASHSFPNGLVFDSAVYSPLSDVPPVTASDSHSGEMQHMAVLKDFRITYAITNGSGAPAIAVQPQSQTVEPGSNATFSVVATGAPTLRYQWRFGATNLAGATDSAFTVTNAQSADVGTYTVVVTNLAGSVTSAPAALSVGSAPVITSQPASQSVSPGATVDFSVVATGTAPLSYQWRLNGGSLAGATTSALTVTNAQATDSGSYSVVVTNLSGGATSDDALLTVSAQPIGIIAQWNFNSITPDAVTGTGSTSPSVGTGTAAPIGGTTQTFFGGSANDPATADNSGWSTTTYPSATAANKSAGVQFNVSTAGRQNITIRWDHRVSDAGSKYGRLRYTTNGTSFIDFPTALVQTAGSTFEPKTNSLVSLPGVDNNPLFAFQIVAEFQATATGSGGSNYVGVVNPYATGGTVRFDMVTVSGTAITVGTAPAITSQPADQAASQGANALFSVQASGTQPLSYQWRRNAAPIPGATASAYTRTNVQPADVGSYSVAVTNTAGSATSSNALLTLIVPSPTLLMESPAVLQWQGLSNLSYTVQGKTNTQGVWSFVGNALSPGATIRFTNQPDASPRFYRVVHP